MRAIVIKQFGGPEALSIEERLAPEPRPGHVLIEVKAFGEAHRLMESNQAGGKIVVML